MPGASKKLKTPEIMKSIDILDRVNVNVMQTSPGHFTVDYQCREEGKVVEFISQEQLRILEQRILEMTHDRPANDPTTRGYIEEFAGRFLHECYHGKTQLVDIVDVTDAPDDHYAVIKQKLAKEGKLN